MTDHDTEPVESAREPMQVRAVYDEIASHFSKTRAYPWPEVESFLEDGPSGRVAVDIGCGNGRHTALLCENYETVVGIDMSRKLLGDARERLACVPVTLLQGDAARLPLQTGSVDVAIYIATVHHLPDRETRVESFAEVARVLSSDGMAQVSAWSTAHDRFDTDPEAVEGFDTTIDWTLAGGETVPRFYHIYAPEEFRVDLEAGGLEIEQFEISSGNCYAHVSTH